MRYDVIRDAPLYRTDFRSLVQCRFILLLCESHDPGQEEVL